MQVPIDEQVCDLCGWPAGDAEVIRDKGGFVHKSCAEAYEQWEVEAYEEWERREAYEAWLLEEDDDC
jgi:hypothetical protein